MAGEAKLAKPGWRRQAGEGKAAKGKPPRESCKGKLQGQVAKGKLAEGASKPGFLRRRTLCFSELVPFRRPESQSDLLFFNLALVRSESKTDEPVFFGFPEARRREVFAFRRPSEWTNTQLRDLRVSDIVYDIVINDLLRGPFQRREKRA